MKISLHNWPKRLNQAFFQSFFFCKCSPQISSQKKSSVVHTKEIFQRNAQTSPDNRVIRKVTQSGR
jgi:hypothetical protein